MCLMWKRGRRAPRLPARDCYNVQVCTLYCKVGLMVRYYNRLIIQLNMVFTGTVCTANVHSVHAVHFIHCGG